LVTGAGTLVAAVYVVCLLSLGSSPEHRTFLLGLGVATVLIETITGIVALVMLRAISLRARSPEVRDEER